MKPMIRRAAVAMLIFTPIALSMGFSQERRLRTPSAARGDSTQRSNAPPAARVPVIRSAGGQSSRDPIAPAARVPSLSTAQKVGYFSAALNLPQVSETSLAGPLKLTMARPIVAGRGQISARNLALVSATTKNFAADTDGIAMFRCSGAGYTADASLELQFMVDEPVKPLLIDFVLEGPPGSVRFRFGTAVHTSWIETTVPGGTQHVPLIYVPTDGKPHLSHYVSLHVPKHPESPDYNCLVIFHSVEITPLK